MREGEGISVVSVGGAKEETFAWGLDRFRAEAQTHVSFRHPNIVSVLRYFEINRTGNLVMEFVEGRTLAEFRQPDDHLSGPEIMSVLGPLLDGTDSVHQGYYLNRDIKPGNTFIWRSGPPV